MKNLKLIDHPPSFFGVLTIIGFLDYDLWVNMNLGPVFTYGGTAVTFLDALFSVVSAKS